MTSESEILKTEITKSGLNLYELARAAGVRYLSLWRWFNGITATYGIDEAAKVRKAISENHER